VGAPNDTGGQEWITFAAPGRRLEGILARPAGAPCAGVAICHPHPQYGGSMHNAVVKAVARELLAEGYAALRFNFSGVGESEGRYSGGPDEIADAHAALAALSGALPAGARLHLVGYSFGAWIALRIAAADGVVDRVVAIAPPLGMLATAPDERMLRPVGIIAAEHDQFSSAARLEAFVREHGDRITIHAVIPGADHFFSGAERPVATACRGFLDASVRD
jgi:hypothetical protein